MVTVWRDLNSCSSQCSSSTHWHQEQLEEGNMSTRSFFATRWTVLGSDGINYAVFLLKLFSLSFIMRQLSDDCRIQATEQDKWPVFLQTVNVSTNKTTKRRIGVLDSQGLKRLCKYISLVLGNPKPLLSFLWLSSMVVTLTCLQRTGQLSGSKVYILQLSDHFLKGSVEPLLPRTPPTACCVLPSTAPLETKSVHFACHHYCHFSIGHFVMQGP